MTQEQTVAAETEHAAEPPLDLAPFVGRWQLVGPHEVRIDDDLIWLRNHGIVGLADQQRLNALCRAMNQRWGYILMLTDVRDLTSVSPEARRDLHQRVRNQTYLSHTVLYGASLMTRTMAMLWQRAAELFTKRSYPISFAKDEEEARALLAAQRLLLRRSDQHASIPPV
jgi:hypothetical protein